ncbi:hypothetical protein [Paraburkholderia aromaticivorans]|uniref:hypothetical protein n=1 Tax=Paraburkholderia aromaticivorans TaxID=2026199 RepID=UPI0038BA2122
MYPAVTIDYTVTGRVVHPGRAHVTPRAFEYRWPRLAVQRIVGLHVRHAGTLARWHAGTPQFFRQQCDGAVKRALYQLCQLSVDRHAVHAQLVFL